MKFRYVILTGFFFAVLLTVSGCSHGQEQDYISYAPEDSRRLIIYTSHPEDVYAPVIKEFEERTGIWVQVETGGTMELLSRIDREKEEPVCDLMFGGGVESLEACHDLFSSYESSLSGLIRKEYRCADNCWTPFSALPIVLIYNPKLVRMNPPSGWSDLLDTSWKGKIAFADPETNSFGYTALATLIQILPSSTEEILPAFTKNLGRHSLYPVSEVITEVANGNCCIGVMPEDDALRAIEDGYDIAIVYPKEGTSAVCDGIAIVSGCRHEENARLFIDFALSEDVQHVLADVCARRSVREDLDDYVGETASEVGSAVSSQNNSDRDFSLFSYDIAWASAHQEEILALWNRLRKEVTP